MTIKDQTAAARAISVPAGLVFRKPTRQDGYSIYKLIKQCPPLDLNSTYTYLLLSEHFADSCIIAELDNEIVGYISAYIHPDKNDVLFVWQVAVHSKARGYGLGTTMLQELFKRSSMANIRFVETTVGPENKASRKMFARFAEGFGASVKEREYFESDLFGPQNHEDENLLRIGPVGETHAA